MEQNLLYTDCKMAVMVPDGKTSYQKTTKQITQLINGR